MIYYVFIFMYSDHGFPLPYSQTLSTSMIFSLLKKNKQNPKQPPKPE